MISKKHKHLIFAVIATLFLLIAFASTAYANSQAFFPITFPVNGKCSFEDSFGAARGGGARSHEGIDIISDKMTPVVAAVDGTVDWLNDGIETSTANGLPYYNLMLRGDDGNDYFYIHLNNDTPGTDDAKGGVVNAYAPGIINKIHVKAGETLAYVGDSGNAEETVSHLHFEIHEGGYKDPIDPYLSLVIAKNGSPFKDVDSKNWCVQYLIELSSKSIIGGYADSTFRPSANVTRGEFIKMVASAAGLKSVAAFDKTFGDVTEDCWSWPYISAAKEAGIVDGDQKGNFNPNDYINRAEAAKIAVKASKIAESNNGTEFKDVSKDYWAFTSIITARSAGLIDGYVDGNYRPLMPITRAEAAKIVDKIFKQCNHD
jgi:murein DD-endopeptidase MepM/ murein hydrolase activator NlpD